MSIVGPRPERPFFVEQFKHRIPQYMLRHKVKAGITGWAQVNGWRGNTSLEKRIEYDLYYIENWSVSLDLKIMWLTLVRGIFSHRAAYDFLHFGASACPNESSSPARPASSGRTSPTPCSTAGTRSSASTTCSPATWPTSPTCTNRDFEFIKHDVTNYIYVDGPVDYVLHFASPASPIDYLELPIPTLKVGALGTHNALGLAKAKGARVPARLDLRGLRRPARAPADGDLLGQRQPDRPARRLRRGQALRRGDDDGLSPLPRARHARSSASSTPTARACGCATAASCRPSCRRRCATRTSRSTATARRRAASATSPTWSTASSGCCCRTTNDPVNIGNPHEMTIEQFAQEIIELTGVEEQDRLQAAAGGRSEGAPAGHHPRPDAARLGAEGRRSREGLTKTIEYFRAKVL